MTRTGAIYVTTEERAEIERLRESGLRTDLVAVIDRLEALSEKRLAQLEECEVQRNAVAAEAAAAVRKYLDLKGRFERIRAQLVPLAATMVTCFERSDVVAEKCAQAARDAMERKAATADFEAPSNRAYTVGDAAGLKRLPDEPVVFPTRGMTAEETRQRLAAELQKRGYDPEQMMPGTGGNLGK